MNEPMQAGMAEATRLTREGRLAEATAVIQNTLGGRFAPPDVPEEPVASARRERGPATHSTLATGAD